MFDYSRKPVKWQVGNFSFFIVSTLSIFILFVVLKQFHSMNGQVITTFF